MDFAELVAPLTVKAFMDEYYGRRPLHVPAVEGSPRASLFSWARLNALLAVQSHWTEANIGLMLNNVPVEPSHYMDDRLTSLGHRRVADVAKIEALLAMGASLVANAVEQVDPEVRIVTDMLADRFSGLAGANLYCSFDGIRAFASHCDAHEVFAIHCAGEKIWRIYENRAEAPLEPIGGDAAMQPQIDAAKGRVLSEFRLRPGDLLYIPRGYYHDAVASGAESLHLTLGVAPLSGRIIFRLLEEQALAEPAFREYLPDGREAGGAPLGERLAALADRLAAMMRSPVFRTEVANAQRKLARPGRVLNLPRRPTLEVYARTSREGSVIRRDEGALLKVAGGGEQLLGALAEEAEWILGRQNMVVQELIARYSHRSEAELRELAAQLERLGLLGPYKPGS
jgi:lysine-specific demethylase/histidyl-hydroxylase NO66